MKCNIVSLRDIVYDLSSGGRPKGGAIGNGVPSLGAEHLDSLGGFYLDNLKYIPSEYYNEMSRGQIKIEDILIVKDGATTGKVSFVDNSFPFLHSAVNEHVFNLKLKKDKIFPKYCFYHLFSSMGKRQILEDFRGATVGGISKSFVDFVKLPLPPLPTQQKIAAILDEADALRRKDKALLAKYDELLQAVFYDIFGDPVKNEKGWEVSSLGDVLDDIVAGSSYGGEERELAADELGVLKISAVTSGEFRSNQFKAIPKSSITKTIITPKKNDLLFSRANTRELVGAMCIVDKDYPTLFLPDKLWRLDLNTTLCNAFYLKNLLAVPDFKDSLTKTATGTSGSMLNISMSKLRDLKIPVPSVDLQNKFSIVAENIQLQKSQIIQQQTHSENVFQSLMQQAFKGELVG